MAASGVQDAIDRARGRAHDVAGLQTAGLAVGHQQQGAALLDEPYLLA